jgi:hypothetical protein
MLITVCFSVCFVWVLWEMDQKRERRNTNRQPTERRPPRPAVRTALGNKARTRAGAWICVQRFLERSGNARSAFIVSASWHPRSLALLDQLRTTRSAGAPLVDDLSILRVRLAREDERGLYFENASSLLTSNGQLAVLLVGLDDPS